MLAVGEYLLGQVDDRFLRIATGLGGGVGGTQQELCGALSGGVLLIGALYGRIKPDEDNSLCMELATLYRKRFAQELGSTNCGILRESGYGSEGSTPCSVLVERAVKVLLDTLTEV